MRCDTSLQLDINRVEWYLVSNYDVHVSFEHDGLDEYWFDPDSIEEDKGVVSINSSETLENQLYTLLHEAGHVALRVNTDEFRSEFPPLTRDTFVGRLDILREEVLAWDKAAYIAKHLGIEVDEEKWRENSVEALAKYIRWTVKEIDNESE